MPRTSEHAHPLEPIAPGLWLSREPVRFLGLHLSSNMTILRLAGDDLLVCSPVALTRERRAAVDALGHVAHLYAPNTFHHLWLADWAAAYPNARVHAPAALAKKRPDLRINRAHDTAAPEPAFAHHVDEHRIDGFRLVETALVHRATESLVVTNLVHNIGRPTHPWTRFYTRAMGFYNRPAVSRFIRLTAFSDTRAARRSIETLLTRPLARMLVGHGAPILEGAREILSDTYAWLPPAPRADALTPKPTRARGFFAGAPCG